MVAGRASVVHADADVAHRVPGTRHHARCLGATVPVEPHRAFGRILACQSRRGGTRPSRRRPGGPDRNAPDGADRLHHDGSGIRLDVADRACGDAWTVRMDGLHADRVAIRGGGRAPHPLLRGVHVHYTRLGSGRLARSNRHGEQLVQSKAFVCDGDSHVRHPLRRSADSAACLADRVVRVQRSVTRNRYISAGRHRAGVHGHSNETGGHGAEPRRGCQRTSE